MLFQGFFTSAFLFLLLGRGQDRSGTKGEQVVDKRHLGLNMGCNSFSNYNFSCLYQPVFWKMGDMKAFVPLQNKLCIHEVSCYV